jgi:peptide chain release factor subunit 1
VTAAGDTARRLLERADGRPVVSLIFDLDPEEFATAPARASQLRSLLDEALRTSRDDASLGHDDRKAVEEDLGRLETYMESGDAPISGARGLAVYVSGDAVEAVPLSHPTPGRIVIARSPYVEPLVAGEHRERWCVALVDRRHGRIFEGEAPDLSPGPDITDHVRGRHKQGGPSQANYERSVEHDADEHLRRVAEEVYRHWQSRPFARLVLGGPAIDVDRFAELLHNDLRPVLADARLALDVEVAGVADVRTAVDKLLQDEEGAERAEVLAQLEERLAAGGRAALGLEPVLAALGERRVERLVLSHNFQARGTRCPGCGLLYPEGTTACPADGGALDPVADLREAAVEAAVLQDAAVTVVGEGSDPPPPILLRGGGVGALLRF